MSGTPARGVVLIVLAAVLGFLVLRSVADRQEVPIVAGATSVIVPTSTPELDTTAGVDPLDPVATVESTGGAGVVTLPTQVPSLDLTSARPKSTVSVLVANGTGVPGQAGRLTDVLRNAGFNTRTPQNADGQPASVIYYQPGYEVEAEVVKQDLLTTVQTRVMPDPFPSVGADIDLGLVHVFVLVGDDALSLS